MNILVCVKQVPNTRHMTIDSQSQRLVRHGVSAMINPADRSALEKALRLRDQQGGRLTVITMGAPQAADVLVSAHLVGADRCILLTDPAFAGSDTFATASVLAAAIRYEQQRTGEDFDIICCGSSTIDGETGQVGPELAELLGILNFTNVSALGFNGAAWELEYRLEDIEMRVCAAPPVLVSCPLTDDACLRSAIPARLERIGEIEIPRLGMDALLPWLNPAETGLNGSATRVLRSYVPSTQRRCVRDMDGFDLCCDFADAIGADIGASRGATDMRLVARQYLIGSNGRTVRPGVYFACGISGSLQHMIGVLDSGCIVAINRDPDAEIHRYANYSVVDDLFSVLPALQEYLLEYL